MNVIKNKPMIFSKKNVLTVFFRFLLLIIIYKQSNFLISLLYLEWLIKFILTKKNQNVL